MAAQLTIRARIEEKVENGEGFAYRVEVSGTEGLHWETVRDIAQSAIDSYYGSVNHRRVAVLGPAEWDMARIENTQDHYWLRVHTF